MTAECERCSFEGHVVYHGKGNICDRDPEYVVNVIAASFKERSGEYVGIVWEAIANGTLRALGWSPGSEVTIGADGRVSTPT